MKEFTDEQLLNKYGWIVECESPFEIRHDDGSFAALQAADITVVYLRQLEEE